PLPADQRGVGLRHVAGEREQQRERVLGGGDDVRLGGVGDDDPALGRGRDVDVVDADPGATDRLHVVRGVDELGGDLRGRADQQPVVLADARGQVEAVGVGGRVDVEVLAQQCYA